MAADVHFIEQGTRVVITCAKYVLVVPRAVFVEGIKAGKRLRRQQTMQARQAYAPGGDDGDLVR